MGQLAGIAIIRTVAGKIVSSDYQASVRLRVAPFVSVTVFSTNWWILAAVVHCNC